MLNTQLNTQLDTQLKPQLDTQLKSKAALPPSSKLTKKSFIKTFGCQMNVYDSEQIKKILSELNFAITEQVSQANLILVNTCDIREKAAEKLYSYLEALPQYINEEHSTENNQAHKTKIIYGVLGCVSQAHGEIIQQRVKKVDFILGPQAYHHLPSVLSKFPNLNTSLNNSLPRTNNPVSVKELPNKKSPPTLQDPQITNSDVVKLDFEPLEKFNYLRQINNRSKSKVSSFLTIQEGCDKFCTFCVVPYTRGAEMSRSFVELLEEANQLVEQGAKEITLLGQNVNAYLDKSNGSSKDLGDLIEALAQNSELKRIRYTTSHPRDVSKRHIEIHKNIAKLMPMLHLPVQSGSNKILKQMNRGHSMEYYCQIIEELKNARPDIAFSSDFIVGFPGETDHDFDQTIELAKTVKFAASYSFVFSPRPGTPASKKNNPVIHEVAKQRLYQLQNLLKQQQQQFDDSCLKTTMPVLFEKKAKKPGQIVGRTPYLQPVHIFADNSEIGQIKNITIQTRQNFSLFNVSKKQLELNDEQTQQNLAEHSELNNPNSKASANNQS